MGGCLGGGRPREVVHVEHVEHVEGEDGFALAALNCSLVVVVVCPGGEGLFGLVL